MQVEDTERSQQYWRRLSDNVRANPDRHACSVYIAVDSRKRPLYVGITGAGRGRFHQHAATSPWWRYVESIIVRHFKSREDAIDVETFLIEAYGTNWNALPGLGNAARGRTVLIAHGLWQDADSVTDSVAKKRRK